MYAIQASDTSAVRVDARKIVHTTCTGTALSFSGQVPWTFESSFQLSVWMNIADLILIAVNGAVKSEAEKGGGGRVEASESLSGSVDRGDVYIGAGNDAAGPSDRAQCNGAVSRSILLPLEHSLVIIRTYRNKL
jgi:hypothetical protein